MWSLMKAEVYAKEADYVAWAKLAESWLVGWAKEFGRERKMRSYDRDNLLVFEAEKNDER